MKIAVLGWGSLIWNPKILNFNKEIGWINEGPILPIEFSRISKNGRLTLVITKDGSDVQSLYSYSTEKNLAGAIQNLREREGTTTNNIGYYIKSTSDFFPSNFEFKQNILEWNNINNFDAVIWTNLSENWKEKTSNRIEYLESLSKERKELAREYIYKTPEQINTALRRKVEDEINWK